ncbi:MAG: hypothetical protein JWO05_1375 [Gemmatimonadetes bacterium]|nr:hypothetical protein [Gemmatimonadota bacterium]
MLVERTPSPRATAHSSFARGLWRIAAADVSGGNRVRLLHDGPETFDAMVALIESATAAVALESYILRSDEVGERIATALLAARARGCTVRLLSDWIGALGIGRRFVARLRDAGIDVRFFNTPGFHRWLGLVPRDHRKLLVVDERAGITGGVGIGREWVVGSRRPRHGRAGKPWRDTAIQIDGPAAHDMQQAFDNIWNRTDKRGRRVERRGAHKLLRREARGTALAPESAPPALVGIVEGVPLKLRIGRALQVQAISAERSIWIASAYFIPSWSDVEALTGAARDGVDVRLLVPSRNDHPWVTLLTRRFYRRLLTNGVRIWEWKGEMMHAKTTVIDGRWVRVGSTDFNVLGVAINYELDAIIEDATLGSEAERMFLADLERSREVHLKGRKRSGTSGASSSDRTHS